MSQYFIYLGLIAVGIVLGRFLKKRYYKRLPRYWDHNTNLVCKECWEHPKKKGKYFVLVGEKGENNFITFLNGEKVHPGICWKYLTSNQLHSPRPF